MKEISKSALSKDKAIRRWQVYDLRRARVDTLIKQMRTEFPTKRIKQSSDVLLKTLDDKAIDWNKVNPHLAFMRRLRQWLAKNYKENTKMMRSFRLAGGINLRHEMRENKTTENIKVLSSAIELIEGMRRRELGSAENSQN
jgi:hypothetical protein